MRIVDAQVHIWAASTAERPWPADHGKPHRPVPLSKDELLREMDAAGVHRVVLVPPPWEGRRNDLVLEAARLHPDRFAVTGCLDLDAPNARDQLATWRQQPGMLALRHPISNQQRTFDDGRGSWVWAEAEKHQVPLMVNVSAANLHLAHEAAKCHPRLKLTIDHLSVPRGKKDAAAFDHLDQLLPLAEQPNIAVKATALPFRSTEGYPYRGLHPYIRRIYDAFGPRRMFWGTDFSKLPCSYRQAITLFTEELPWLTDEEKDWIMGRALCEWIGWTLQ